MSRRGNRTGDARPGPKMRAPTGKGLLQVKGGFSQMVRAGSAKDGEGGKKALQFRLKIVIDESSGPPEVRRAIALSRLADIIAMRDALVAVGRGPQAEYLMRKAGAAADDAEKFAFALAAANVVMTRPTEKASEASSKFTTWGQLARAWASQELARLYPNAGYAKKSAEETDTPRVEFLCKYIENVPLATFNDDDYWRAMRPAREHCKTDSTFKAYAQVARRVLKIAVELKIIPAWPLSAVCKLPIVEKGKSPEFPFLYPEEYVRLVRCALIRFEYRVLWGFIIREGLRISEAYRIRWHHLSQLPNGKWLLDVPETKTGRALNFVLNAGSGEVLAELRRRMPELEGPFTWLKVTNLEKAAADLRRHVELSGTTRKRLLYTDGRLRRLREHDLRSTYVTWSKLAGVDNETISQHTGHESSTMIARYNRSKATIEHLGLAPYLPLDEAFGGALREGGELAGLLGAGDGMPPLLGAGEPHAAEPSAHETVAAVHAAVAALHAGAPSSVTSPLQPAPGPANAQPTAEGFDWTRDGHGRPGAYVQIARGERARVDYPGAGGADLVHRGEAPIVLATSPLGERTIIVTSQAQLDALLGTGAPRFPQPAEPVTVRRLAGGAPVPEGHPWRPCCGSCGAAFPAGAGEHRDTCPACGEPWDGSELGPDAEAPASPTTRQRGAQALREACAAPADADHEISGGAAEPLNTGAGCDGGCDGRHTLEREPTAGDEKSSVFDAVREKGLEPPCPLGRRNLKPAQAPPNQQNPGNPGVEGAPERAGSDGPSHPGVTLLGQLQAAHAQASAERNWAAARALEPLIDAEVARLAAARAAAPPAPVSLAVVRARKGGAS